MIRGNLLTTLSAECTQRRQIIVAHRGVVINCDTGYAASAFADGAIPTFRRRPVEGLTMTYPLSRLPSRYRPAAALSTLLFASVVAHSTAWGEETCTPPCAQGQVCYQRTCMVPAPPPPPAAAAP